MKTAAFVLAIGGGCIPDRVRYVDLPIPPETALVAIDEELAGRGFERRGSSEEPVITFANRRPHLWTPLVHVGIHAREGGTRVALTPVARRAPDLFEHRGAIEVRPYQELGFGIRWSAEPQVAIGAQRVNGDDLLRMSVGARVGREVARTAFVGERSLPHSTARLGVGLGITLFNRDASFRPAVSIAWERQRFVEYVSGERLPTGRRLYLELEAAGLLGDTSGAEIAFAAGFAELGAVVVSAGWFGGRTTSIAYRMGTEASAYTSLIVVIVAGVIAKGADALTDTWDGPD